MDGFFFDATNTLLSYGVLAVPAITAAVLVGCGSSSNSTRNAKEKSEKRDSNSVDQKRDTRVYRAGKGSRKLAALKKPPTEPLSERGFFSRIRSSNKKDVSNVSKKSQSQCRSSKKISSKNHRKSTKKSLRDKSASVSSKPKSVAAPGAEQQKPPQPASAASMKTSVSVKKSDSVQTPNDKDGVVAEAVSVGKDTSGILKLTPPNLRFNNHQTETLDVQLKNQSKETIAVKVKCSDNQIYRVDPVYATLEPDQIVKVSVRRESTSFKIDKLVFAVLKVPKGFGNARDAFGAKASNVHETLFVLPLFTTNALSAYSALAVSENARHQQSQSAENPLIVKNPVAVQ